jgi:hypothetical protein
LVVVVEMVAVAEFGIEVDVAVGDMPGIVAAVVPIAVVETVQMRGPAGRAPGQKPEGETMPPPGGIVPKGGWGVMTTPEVESGR